MKRTHCIALAALALGVLVVAPSAQAQTKKVTFATTPLALPAPTRSYALDINNFGQIVGYVYANGSTTTNAACIWEQISGQWIVRELGSNAVFNQVMSIGDISDLGPLVVGYGNIDGTETAFCYNDLTGTWEILPNLPNNFESRGSSVNNHGVICGNSHNNDGVFTATIWERPEGGPWTASNLASPFETLQGRTTSMNDLNDAGQVIGNSYATGTSSRAHVWQRNDQGAWS